MMPTGNVKFKYITRPNLNYTRYSSINQQRSKKTSFDFSKKSMQIYHDSSIKSIHRHPKCILQYYTNFSVYNTSVGAEFPAPARLFIVSNLDSRFNATILYLNTTTACQILPDEPVTKHIRSNPVSGHHRPEAKQTAKKRQDGQVQGEDEQKCADSREVYK